ncbi:MAG: hypothetical protein GX936_10055 [Clostridiales bacterium]|jgi:hypothetical protein|nr:hypothetical protein [Clostridiales bacterium]
MISVVLLLKIIGVLCFIAGWACLVLYVRRTALRLEELRAYCEERLDMPAREPDEERRTALEAERRFTEGIANILNYSHTPAYEADARQTGAGRKNDP